MEGNSKCINYACKSGNNMLTAPQLCLSYYRVKKHKKTCFVCKECYFKSMKFYGRSTKCLVNGEKLTDVKIPFRNDLVEVDDSDEEEQFLNDEECLSLYETKHINNFDHILNNIVVKYKVKEQSDMLDAKLDQDIARFESRFDLCLFHFVYH